ncbi:hypothetical protein LVJ85_10950 [Neisseria sp. Dent CA1/247]|uniref:ADP-ribosyltransferase-containing protein n=1 Tax=Neisseria sp. Dent CA1/247 TaxID=2912675 RepID=UPI001FD0FFB6|nr:hypothetical protein [Neisseria sp. Dent CA1/247]UOO76512.1 hypothetical protein LVJ85_10950 [Neisseria sp. Dent CA1/247]
MPEAKYGESPGFYITEKRLGGRTAYDAAKAAGKTGLDYRQWVQVRTDEFKNWFGDWENGRVPGRLLDANGEPKIFYPEPAADTYGLTRDISFTEKQRRRVRETVTEYVKYGADGQVSAISTQPKDGYIPEQRNRTRTVYEDVAKTETVHETLRFSRVDANTFHIRVEGSNRFVGGLLLTHEKNGGQGFSGSRPLAKQDGSRYFVPYRVEIEEAYWSKGVGSALYRFAEQCIGEEIYPARSQTGAAKALWQKRNRQGGFGGYFMNVEGQIKSAVNNSGLFDRNNPDTGDPLPQEILEDGRRLYRGRMAAEPPGLEKHRLQTQEQAMEKTISGLPAEVQLQARINFYQSHNSRCKEQEQAYEAAKASGKTELDFHQWKLVRTEEFKNWFGDWENDPSGASKVVNRRTGEPLVVYHGTRDKAFGVFDLEKSAIGYWGKGFYFAESRSYAEQAAGENGRVMPVFLRLNPESPSLYPPSERTPVIEAVWYDEQDNRRDLGRFSTADAAQEAALRQGIDIEGLVLNTVYVRGNQNPLMNDIEDLVYLSETRTEKNALLTIAAIRGRGFDGIYSPSENFYVAFDPGGIEPAGNCGSLKSNLIPLAETHLSRPSETLQTAFSNGGTKQSTQGSLNVLKHLYLMQTATLSPEDKQHRTVLEHALEKTISGLPADVQLQARINFYRSQTQAVANKYETTPERQAETGIER